MDTYNENNAIDLIWLAQILIIIAFFALLIMAIVLLSDFYIADSSNCKTFRDAALAGELDSKEYAIALTNSLLSDGIWPIAYLASAITTGFIILGLGIPATIQNIIIIFLFSFIPYYAMILFLYHHYVQFVKTAINNYIVNSTPNPIISEEKDVDDKKDVTNDKKDIDDKKNIDDKDINDKDVDDKKYVDEKYVDEIRT